MQYMQANPDKIKDLSVVFKDIISMMILACIENYDVAGN